MTGKGCLGGEYAVSALVRSDEADELIKPELRDEYPLWHVFCECGKVWENLRIMGTLPEPGQKIRVMGYSGQLVNDPLAETTPEGNLVRRPSWKLGECERTEG